MAALIFHVTETIADALELIESRVVAITRGK